MEIILAAIGIIAGVGGTLAYEKSRGNNGKAKSDQMISSAKSKASDILVKAKEDSLKIADEAKKEEAERRKDWQKTDNRLAERETSLDKKFDEIDKRNESLRKQEDEVDSLKNEIREIRGRQQEKLEKIARLSKKEATDKLLQMTERGIKQDLVR